MCGVLMLWVGVLVDNGLNTFTCWGTCFWWEWRWSYLRVKITACVAKIMSGLFVCFLCRLQSITTHRDHFVRPSSVTLSRAVSEATHAFLGMLPLFCWSWSADLQTIIHGRIYLHLLQNRWNMKILMSKYLHFCKIEQTILWMTFLQENQ